MSLSTHHTLGKSLKVPSLTVSLVHLRNILWNPKDSNCNMILSKMNLNSILSLPVVQLAIATSHISRLAVITDSSTFLRIVGAVTTLSPVVRRSSSDKVSVSVITWKPYVKCLNNERSPWGSGISAREPRQPTNPKGVWTSCRLESSSFVTLLPRASLVVRRNEGQSKDGCMISLII